jgi:hypothetical protein
MVSPWPPYYSYINHCILPFVGSYKGSCSQRNRPKIISELRLQTRTLTRKENVTDNSRWTEQNFPTWVCCAAELTGEHTDRVLAQCHDERRLAERAAPQIITEL